MIQAVRSVLSTHSPESQNHISSAAFMKTISCISKYLAKRHPMRTKCATHQFISVSSFNLQFQMLVHNMRVTPIDQWTDRHKTVDRLRNIKSDLIQLSVKSHTRDTYSINHWTMKSML